MINVVLIDDHAVTRKGVKTIIELNPEIRVVFEASNGKEFLDKMMRTPVPDVAILDINMPEMNGIQVIREIHDKYAGLKIIVFSYNQEEDTVINMISLGASGYISKAADPSVLVKAIISVYENDFYIGELGKKQYFNVVRTGKNKPGFTGKQYLSPKELEFIKLSATNLTYKEMAEIMEVSPKTIENYRDSLFLKLDLKNRAALALYGYRNGLITSER